MERDNLRDKRQIRTEKSFRDAFIQLCKECDINDVTVSKIADRAQYSRAAFYSHFESKEQFIIHLLNQEAEYIYSCLCLGTKNVIESERREADIRFFAHVYQNRDLYILLLENRLLDNAIDYMSEILLEHSQKGIPELDKIMSCYRIQPDMSLLLYASFYQYLAMAKYWLRNGMLYSPNYMAEQKELLKVPFDKQ